MIAGTILIASVAFLVGIVVGGIATLKFDPTQPPPGAD